MFCYLGFADSDLMSKGRQAGLPYGEWLGRRLPMTAFEELSLNETRGNYVIILH